MHTIDPELLQVQQTFVHTSTNNYFPITNQAADQYVFINSYLTRQVMLCGINYFHSSMAFKFEFCLELSNNTRT